MITLDTYIDREVDLTKNKNCPAMKWIIERNNLIIGKKVPNMCVFAATKNTIIAYRTFDTNIKLDNGLSFDNPILEDTILYLLHPPFPDRKEASTWIVTNGTFEFFILMDHVDEAIMKKMRTYIPCDLALNNYKDIVDYGDSSRHDYIFNNKKIGSIDVMAYNDQSYININVNGSSFSQNNNTDIISSMKRYNDNAGTVAYSIGSHVKSPYVTSGIGGADFTFDELKDHFMDYAKDVIDFKIVCQ